MSNHRREKPLRSISSDVNQKKSPLTRLGEVWMNEPLSLEASKRVLRALVSRMKALGFLTDDEVDIINGGDIASIKGAAELLPIMHGKSEEVINLSLGLTWVASCMGDKEAMGHLVSALCEESASSSPRRKVHLINRLAVRWMNRINGVKSTSDVDNSTNQKDNTEGNKNPNTGKFRELKGILAEKNIKSELVTVQELYETDQERGERHQDNGESDNNEKENPTYLDFNDVGESFNNTDDAVDNNADNHLIVCHSIGDANSKEGRDITQRYDGILGKPLSFSGTLDDPLGFKRNFESYFPWADSVARFLGGQISLLHNSGNNALRLPPILLVGPPGSGKTKMLEWMADQLEAKWMTIACGGVIDTGGLSAVSRGWASSRPSAPVQAMAELNCANPILILDELDKGSNIGSKNGSVMATLISMLQNSGQYYDPCLLSNVNISNVSFMATANDISEFPDALRDRFVIFRVPRPDDRHFSQILTGIRENEAKRLHIDEKLLPWLQREDISWLRNVFLEANYSIRSLEQAHRLIVGERAAEEVERAKLLN